MKKGVIYVMVLLVLLLPLSVRAEEGDFKANDLQIESSRLEEDRKSLDTNGQLDLTASLFSADDKDKLAVSQEADKQAFQARQDALFEGASPRVQEVMTVAPLFTEMGAGTAYSQRKTQVGQAGTGTWSSLLYSGFCLSLVLGASFASYRVYEKG